MGTKTLHLNWFIFYMNSYLNLQAALNLLTKTLSLELKSSEIMVVALHPGWVRTDMGGPHARVSTEESVLGILKLLPTLQVSDTGKLYEFTGREMAW